MCLNCNWSCRINFNLKNDKDEYDKIYEQCLKVCEDNRIDIEEERRGKKRKGAESNNYSHQDVFQKNFQTLIQVFYDYIKEISTKILY
jgi:hypothetical protein